LIAEHITADVSKRKSKHTRVSKAIILKL